uniref:Uncharacterized protein n=1 Tax=Salmonella phage vB_SEnST11_KE24 TaxID=3161175 RepID=A0AAU8GJ29_9CAUD
MAYLFDTRRVQVIHNNSGAKTPQLRLYSLCAFATPSV